MKLKLTATLKERFMHRIIIVCTFLLLGSQLFARTQRYRVMWREDPATTIAIGWDQKSGSNTVVYYDEVDRGQNMASYRMRKSPDLTVNAKGMNNTFVRLSGLKPATLYYFVIGDSDGASQRFSFRTAPNTPTERLSIIAGGDSRNNREARVSANTLVSKLRATCVMFNGDMTAGDTAPEWQTWLDDWQSTISSDGRMYPLVVARGNHEASNKSLTDIFDITSPNIYYSLTLGGNLIKLITLNSLVPAGGEQRSWLENELKSAGSAWKMIQYHHAIRPHTAGKPERDDLWENWASLFYQYRVDVCTESDSHVAKWTYPLRPSNEIGSAEGYIRDDEKGTVYIGEGCWGAPLRENNDDKKWTRNSGSFNHFDLLYVDASSIEIRSILTDNANSVQELKGANPCILPIGIKIWEPSNGSVLTIPKVRKPAPPSNPTNTNNNGTATTKPVTPPVTAPPTEQELVATNDREWAKLPLIKVDAVTGDANIPFDLAQAGEVLVQVYTTAKKEVAKANFPNLMAGPNQAKINLKTLSAGRHLVVIRAQGKALKFFQYLKN
jgi:hypothetical protein